MGRGSRRQGDETGAVERAPEGVRATRFDLDGEEYAVIVLSVGGKLEHLPARLTEAEAEVAHLALNGFSNEQIGDSRGVSARTVANQLQGIYRKLGIGSRTELACVLGRTDLSRANGELDDRISLGERPRAEDVSPGAAATARAKRTKQRR